MSDCPSALEVEQVLGGELKGPRKEAVFRHLLRCDACQRRAGWGRHERRAGDPDPALFLHATPEELAATSRGEAIDEAAAVHIAGCVACQEDALAVGWFRAQAATTSRRRYAAAAIVVMALSAAAWSAWQLPWALDRNGAAGDARTQGVDVPDRPATVSEMLIDASDNRLTAAEATMMLNQASTVAMILDAPIELPESFALRADLYRGVTAVGDGDLSLAREELGRFATEPHRWGSPMLAVVEYASGVGRAAEQYAALVEAMDSLDPDSGSDTTWSNLHWFAGRAAMDAGNPEQARAHWVAIVEDESANAAARALAEGMLASLPR